jgi:hypothetical protein
MIRIDEIYDNVFLPIIEAKSYRSMLWFAPFGRTDADALKVFPRIKKHDNIFIFWDQEPFLPEIHSDTIKHINESFIFHQSRAPTKRLVKKCNAIFITSEKNSQNIDKLYDDYGYKANYYFFHGWAALDWFRGYDRTFLINDYKNRDITNTFICPNRIVSGLRKHRLSLVQSMAYKNLVTTNRISFPEICPSGKTRMHITGVDLPLVFKNETSENIPNESFKVSLWEEAKNSLVHIVTETLYEQDTLHLTEKTFKPIVMQMPFMLVAPKYSLEYLKSYGFKTFAEFWSEEYDILDNADRINAITTLLLDLENLSYLERRRLQQHIAPIVEHNFNWFYSGKFEKILWTELNDMVTKWH